MKKTSKDAWKVSLSIFKPLCVYIFFIESQRVGNCLTAPHHRQVVPHGWAQCGTLEDQIHKGIGGELVQDLGIEVHDAGAARTPRKALERERESNKDLSDSTNILALITSLSTCFSDENFGRKKKDLK